MNEPSKWAIEASIECAKYLGMYDCVHHPESTGKVCSELSQRIEVTIDAACAANDKRIAALEKELNCALEALKVK